MPVTERQVQAKFWERRNPGFQLMISNFTPLGWHEADLWCVSKAGYAHEYEIKLTRSDFKADADKTDRTKLRPEWDEKLERRIWRRGQGENKYARLEAGEGPRRFFYLVPDGLLTVDDLPKFAGLVTFTTGRWWKFRIVRAAPSLHSKPALPKDIERAREAFYWRYWRLIGRFQKSSKNMEDGG